MVDGLNVGVRVHPVIHSMYAVDVSQMVAAVGELVGVHVLVSRRGGGGGAAHISSASGLHKKKELLLPTPFIIVV